MLRSMTGFGRATESFPNRNITVEMRCVNHRFLECSVRIPRTYAFLEDKIKGTVQKSVSRGKLEISVLIENTGSDEEKIEPNTAVAAGYLRAIRTIEEELELQPSPISAIALSRFPDVFRVTAAEIDEEEIAREVLLVTEKAVEAFLNMRETEGGKLKEDLSGRLDSIEALLGRIENLASGFLGRYTEKLYTRMKQVLEATDIDDARILTEAALYADKSAIDEETVRLHSHIAQFRSMLESGEPVGRKLDFLVQEMNRETNTIGSKSSELEITGCVVDIKAEIEKIREQIQNVE